MTARAIQVSRIVGICVVLIALVWIVFGQTTTHEFVNYDDGAYVFRNSEVTRGVSAQGIRWAFTHPVAGNWHPLTVLSHMLDCQLYGIRPAGHHFTSTALHSIAAVLLFFALWQMTGRPSRTVWRSAFVAGVFAIHPLHVESVAWVAERKDVLSGVLFMLTIIAYVSYTRQPTALRYALMAGLFAAGLMAKPMLVTVPAILLLLDYWPLQRWQGARSRQQGAKRKGQSGNGGRGILSTPSVRGLVWEKIPLFVLSAASAIATIVTQSKEISVANSAPFIFRIGNAFVSLVIYLRQTLWPRDLGVFYPQHALPSWEVILAVAVVIGISVAVFMLRKERPYLLVGWLWFVGMLVPVIGLVQVGDQAHADRYTYLPQIGLCLAATWGIADLFAGVRSRYLILGTFSFAVVLALTCSAYVQTEYWRSSDTLWTHTVAVTSDNENGYEHLSEAYLEKGRTDDAIAVARQAVDRHAHSAHAHGVLGAAYTRNGNLSEALQHLQKAAELDPKLPRVHFNLANTLAQRGQLTEAISEYETELNNYPGFAEGHNNLANALLRAGRPDEALEHLQTALTLNPNYPEARNNLAIVLSQKGRMSEAVAEWNKTLAIDPNNLEAECNLGWVLSTFRDSTVRNGARAVELTQRALRISDGKNARIWRLAAAAYAEAGQFDNAIKAAQSGITVAESEGNAGLVETLKANVRQFEQRLPLRD